MLGTREKKSFYNIDISDIGEEERALKHITLLTDYGTRDGYPGVMKGIIWKIAPDTQIADITHNIMPQNILEGGLALARAAPFYPDGTVHVATVDPGVGTSRRLLAARVGRHFFVGPDNGLISLLVEQTERAGETVEFVHLDQPRFWLPEVSNVFHGRDIFAPTAAHLVNGVALTEVGTTIHDPVLRRFPEPERNATGWRGAIIAVDRFGNLITNIEERHLNGARHLQVTIRGERIPGLARTFGDASPGELIALIGTDHDLTVAAANSNAAGLLGAGVGDVVDVTITK